MNRRRRADHGAPPRPWRHRRSSWPAWYVRDLQRSVLCLLSLRSRAGFLSGAPVQASSGGTCRLCEGAAREVGPGARGFAASQTLPAHASVLPSSGPDGSGLGTDQTEPLSAAACASNKCHGYSFLVCRSIAQFASIGHEMCPAHRGGTATAGDATRVTTSSWSRTDCL
jgi:hypothetical protein